MEGVSPRTRPRLVGDWGRCRLGGISTPVGSIYSCSTPLPVGSSDMSVALLQRGNSMANRTTANGIVPAVLSILLPFGLMFGPSSAGARPDVGVYDERSQRGEKDSDRPTIQRTIRDGVQVVTITNEGGNLAGKIWARPEAVITPDGSVIDGGAGGISIDQICGLPELRQTVETSTRMGLACNSSSRSADAARRPRFKVKACKRLPNPEAHACWSRAVPKRYNRHHRRIVATERAYISSNGRPSPNRLKRLKTGWHYVQPTSPASHMPYKTIFDRGPAQSRHSNRSCITVSGSVTFTPAGIGGSVGVSFPLCRGENYFPSTGGSAFTNHFGNWSKHPGIRKIREWRTVRALASVSQKRNRYFKKWLVVWKAKRNGVGLFPSG
jgi:hypothetical protein